MQNSPTVDAFRASCQQRVFSLRQLNHFVLLAEELHFMRAAARACLSQSALSRSIQALERQAGIRLFDRGQTDVRLTRAGERIYVGARRLVTAAADLDREVGLLRAGELGDLSLGAGPFSGLALMPEVLADLRHSHPSVSVRLEVSDPLALLDRLKNNHLDFFVAEIREIPISEDLLVERLGLMVGGIYCRTGHPLTRRSSQISAKALQAWPLASVPLPATLARGLSLALGLAQEISFALECDSPQILLDYVARTDTLLFAISSTVKDAVRAGSLQLLAITELEGIGDPGLLASELGIVQLRHRSLPPSATIVQELLRVTAARLLS
jgi:DNA-binding transcriptional LysR family regulator